ncbi:MAG: GDSL-type esterase/lipase family protein, partial [Leeuwenhoekiella sp.]
MKKLSNKFLGLCLVLLGNVTYVHAQDWANLNRYKEDNAKIDTTSSETRVVFMGNSITEGWVGNDPEFFKEHNYIGRGISGQTTPQMLLRFRPDVIDLKPAAVVILAGTNDIAGNTGPTTLETIFGNIQSMAELAHANDIKVLISSVLPAAKYPWKPEVESVEPILKLNAMLKAYAEENNFVYLDYFPATANAENGMLSSLTEDGV